MDWKPMIDAPKDREILLWADGNVIGYWVEKTPFQDMSGWSMGTSDSYPEWDYEIWIVPDAWQELPEGPYWAKKD